MKSEDFDILNRALANASAALSTLTINNPACQHYSEWLAFNELATQALVRLRSRALTDEALNMLKRGEDVVAIISHVTK